MKNLFLSAMMGALTLGAASSAQAITVTVNGSGCPIGGEAQAYWDGDELVIPTGEMRVKKGYDVEPSNKRKNCAVTLASEHNNRLAVRSIRAKGWTDLRSGDDLKLSFDRFIQGDGRDFNLSFTAKGPENQGFDFYYKLKKEEQVWSECSPTRALTLNAALLLQGEDKQFAQAELDELRVRVDTLGCR